MSFGSLSNSFDEGQFRSILRSLERHKDLFATSISIHEATKARTWVVQHQQEIEQHELERQVTRLQNCISWLSVEDHVQTDRLDRLIELRQPDSCNWILDNYLLASWIERPKTSPILWITGLPGAGKHTII